MAYSIERQIQIEEERKARKAEKERLKKEKEEQKKKEKKALHKKKLKSKQNKRAYAKRRKAELEERNKKGDEYGVFSVYITKNNKRIKWIGKSWWKTEAYAKYNEAIENNQKNVKFPVTFTTSHTDNIRKNNRREVKYEIILVQKVYDPDNEDLVKQFRDENGKFIDNIITDSNEHVIIAKHEWLIEELFNVYGYHPEKDRKNYDFILNNIVLNNYKDKYDCRQILSYNNKVIVSYLDDFDFIICKTPDAAQKLYNQIEKDVLSLKLKYILFMGEVGETQKTDWLNKIEEKTGWPRESIIVPSLI